MKNKSALLAVFLVVLIDLMGFGIVLPLLPFYAEKFGVSAVQVGLLYSVYSLAQLIFSPFWGSLSDRIGRRPVMLLSTLGSSVSYLIFAVSGSFAMLFASRLMAGVMGGNISTAQAYVADVTDEKSRAQGMGILGAAFGIGFVVGPALTALLIQPFVPTFLGGLAGETARSWSEANKYAIPGLAACLLSAASFLLVLLKLPETVNGRVTTNDASRITKRGIWTRAFWVELSSGSSSSKKAGLGLLFISVLLIAVGHSSLYSAFPLYCKQTLGFLPAQVSMQFVYMGLIAVLVQGGLTRMLVKRFSEEKLFLIGCFVMLTGLALIPTARSSREMIFVLGIMTIGASLNGPSLNSLISKTSDPSRVGATMGASQSFSSLGRVLGPTWGGFLFGVWPRLPFFATAALLLPTLLVGVRLMGVKNASLRSAQD